MKKPGITGGLGKSTVVKRGVFFFPSNNAGISLRSSGNTENSHISTRIFLPSARHMVTALCKYSCNTVFHRAPAATGETCPWIVSADSGRSGSRQGELFRYVGRKKDHEIQRRQQQEPNDEREQVQGSYPARLLSDRSRERPRDKAGIPAPYCRCTERRSPPMFYGYLVWYPNRNCSGDT